MAKQSARVTQGRVICIYGPNGVGKTKSLATFAHAGYRVRVQDADGQARVRLRPEIAKGLVKVEPWTTFEQVAALYSNLLNGRDIGADVLAFDSLTMINEEWVREGKSKPEEQGKDKRSIKQVEWNVDRKPAAEMLGTMLLWGKRMADPAYVEHPVHIVYTTHEAYRMVAASGATQKEIESGAAERVAGRGPSLPGKLMQNAGMYFQEFYHMVALPNSEDPAVLDRWFVTQFDGEWPAKGSEGLEMYEEPDFGKLLKKLE